MNETGKSIYRWKNKIHLKFHRLPVERTNKQKLHVFHNNIRLADTLFQTICNSNISEWNAFILSEGNKKI